MKSNLSFEQLSNEISLITIYNNIGDVNGAFKNVSEDTTNDIFFKIDDYDYDLTSDTVTMELNINYSEIKKFLKNDKFIKLLNNNNYYLK
jgi:hypothetical protein